MIYTTVERARFEAQVVQTETCHLWAGHRNRYGYGQLTIRRKTMVAHRVAWEIKHGAIPEKMQVLHKCDTPSCVNVEGCLFLGTHRDNHADKARKGRVKGPRHPQNKMSEIIAEEMRSLHEMGVSQHRLAVFYGMSQQSVSLVCLGRHWTTRAGAVVH